jgi:meiotically up-regulated gene 157 (Mug157) protein
MPGFYENWDMLIKNNMNPTDLMLHYVANIQARLSNEKWKKVYRNCFFSTWQTTMTALPSDTFLITGDIPAMWLRDSSLQIAHYLPLIKQDKVLRSVVEGLIKRQFRNILIDPYANAFNQSPNGSCWNKNDRTERNPWVWERKYETDSLAFPLWLLSRYLEITSDSTILTGELVLAINKVIDIWKTEQDHESLSSYRFERDSPLPTESLKREGKGTLTAWTGMTWSGFRPSDDACTWHYLIPSNMLAVSVLKDLLKNSIPGMDTGSLIKLVQDIQKGILEHAVVEKSGFGEVFAYEVDGFGNSVLMDDANFPSLLSIPFFGFCRRDDPVYQNTRRMLLTHCNPFYFEGKAAKGIGSPHTPHNYIWPMALVAQGLTAETAEEKEDIINILLNTDGNTGFMHESFNVNNPGEYTRPWFAWANSMFALLTEDYLKSTK